MKVTESMSYNFLKILPNFNFEERHSIQNIHAPAHAILQAIVNFDSRVDPWMNRLIELRELPSRFLMFFSKNKTSLPQRNFGLEDFTMLQKNDSEVAYGLVGRFWQVSYGLLPCEGLTDFQSNREQTICRLLLTFHLTPSANGFYKLETVTRVACSDAQAKLRFSPYWYLIRPFSGLIRNRILRQIKRSSEALS